MAVKGQKARQLSALGFVFCFWRACYWLILETWCLIDCWCDQQQTKKCHGSSGGREHLTSITSAHQRSTPDLLLVSTTLAQNKSSVDCVLPLSLGLYMQRWHLDNEMSWTNPRWKREKGHHPVCSALDPHNLQILAHKEDPEKLQHSNSRCQSTYRFSKIMQSRETNSTRANRPYFNPSIPA